MVHPPMFAAVVTNTDPSVSGSVSIVVYPPDALYAAIPSELNIVLIPLLAEPPIPGA